MKRRSVWFWGGIILLLLLIIFLLFWLFGGKGKSSNQNNLAFPVSTTTVQRQGTVNQNTGAPSEGSTLTQAPTSRPASVFESPYQYSGVSYSGPAPVNTLPTQFAFPPAERPPARTVSFTNPTSTPASYNPITYVPPVTTPVRRNPFPPNYTSGTGSRLIGHSHDGQDIFFNPQTGDLFVGNLHFNFGGANAIPGQTSDIVGDPDNLTIGTSLGTLIGSLLGNPGIGTIIGTAIGSNLFAGHRLSDLGIGLEGGLLTLNGQDAIGLLTGSGSGIAGILGGSGLGSALGGITGNSYFGGRTFAFPCTCTEDLSFFVVSDPVQYAGTYLYNPLTSTSYNNHGFFGYFESLGSYSPLEGAEECWMIGPDSCFLLPIDKGKINGSPGYGTSSAI